MPDELRIVAMASGALVALLNTTNNRCYSTLREFFVPHQRLLVLLRLDHDPSSIRSGWLGRPHLAAFFGASGGGYGVV